MISKLLIGSGALMVALALSVAYAQSTTPVVSPGTQPAPVSAGTQPKADSMGATIKSLLELKTANEQILKKQRATLEALDELQKAADQIKIFSKRG